MTPRTHGVEIGRNVPAGDDEGVPSDDRIAIAKRDDLLRFVARRCAPTVHSCDVACRTADQSAQKQGYDPRLSNDNPASMGEDS